MADNIKYPGPGVSLNVAVPVGTVSGDPVEIVDMHGVALTDRDSNGYATVKFGFMYVADLAVEAVNHTVGSAVAIGDKLYYDSAATIKINKDSTDGKAIGYALEAIVSGSSDTIMVGMID